MAEVRVVWTRLALDDLEHAHEYIEAANPQGAHAMIDQIERAIGALISFPEIGRPGRIEGTRELVVVGTPFVVPYRVLGQSVNILGVIHSARRWPGDL